MRRAVSSKASRLTGLTVFTFDPHSKFKERIEAREAALEDGRWLFKGVRRFTLDNPPVEQEPFVLPTSLTPAQVQNSFSTPKLCHFGNFRVISGPPRAQDLPPQDTGCNTTNLSHSRFCWLQW